jgi:poly(3-hydroxybutyrate) depolymerase
VAPLRIGNNGVGARQVVVAQSRCDRLPHSRKNNLTRSFNWFQRNDAQRGEGEAHSIVQMVRDHDIDRKRIFVTGLWYRQLLARTRSAAMAAIPPLLKEQRK